MLRSTRIVRVGPPHSVQEYLLEHAVKKKIYHFKDKHTCCRIQSTGMKYYFPHSMVWEWDCLLYCFLLNPSPGSHQTHWRRQDQSSGGSLYPGCSSCALPSVSPPSHPCPDEYCSKEHIPIPPVSFPYCQSHSHTTSLIPRALSSGLTHAKWNSLQWNQS